MVRLAGRVFRVVVVDRVVADDLERRKHLDLGRGEDPDGDLGPRDEALHEHAPVVAKREHKAAGHGVGVLRDGQADGRALAHRLDHRGEAEACDQPLDDVGAHTLPELELLELGHVQAGSGHDLARPRLVHAQR